MADRIPGPLCRTLNPAIPPNDPETRNVGATAPPTIVGMPQYQAASGGASLVTDLDFESLIEEMEEDAAEAHAEWESYLSDDLFSYLELKVFDQYRADGTDCEKAQGTFNTEWNEIASGRGDPKKLLAAYDIFSLRLGALQRANERIDALKTIVVVKMLVPWLDWVMRMSKFHFAQKFLRQLEELEKELVKAESEVTKAEVKTALNLALSAITTLVTPAAQVAKLVLAGGAIVVHIVIDKRLGEGSVTGGVVFVAGDAGEFVELNKHGKDLIEKVKGGSKTIGVAAAAITFALDFKDLYEGKERVEELKKSLEEVQKGYDEFMTAVLPMMPGFSALERTIQLLPAALNKALAAGNDAAKNYDAVKRKIQAVIR